MSKNLLQNVSTPTDLRKLAPEELPHLAAELRTYIIDTLAQGEGHLGASLGTVELTLALHYVFDTPTDLLLWDVGHQAYAHKILTNRREAFQQLRQAEGLSGFPKREESPFDAFGTGHAGTSISAALGMALAGSLQHQNRQHIAVIGDASLASGMALEALNHLATTQANVLVVLNDNSMGIDPSVGALKDYLNQLKMTSVRPDYFPLFDLPYSGPIEGHDLEQLLDAFQQEKKKTGPRLMHVVTTKGKGLKAAEQNQIAFHAPGKFDPLTGKLQKQPLKGKVKFQTIVGETLVALAEKNDSIVVITPAMPTGSGLIPFMKKYPERCIDVGIAEQHAVTLAAGLATQGLLPICVLYSTFLQRAYDQVIHDVALQKLPVLFCVDRAGLVGHDGATHHGVFDIAFLRCIPHLTVLAPRNLETLRNMLYTLSLAIKGPVAIRYPRDTAPTLAPATPFQKIDFQKMECLKQQGTIALISVGTLANRVAQALDQTEAPEAFAHYDLKSIKPLDTETLTTIFETHIAVVVIEEGVVQGGAGSAVLESMHALNFTKPFYQVGIPDAFISHGSPALLHQKVGLDPKGLTKRLNSIWQKHRN